MRPEEREQQHGIQLLRSLGADVYVSGTRRPRPAPGCPVCLRNMSTRQTPGIPDVHAYVPIRGTEKMMLVVWEVKAPKFGVSPAQVRYAENCKRAGVPYVRGDYRTLLRALIDWGLVSEINRPLTL